MSESPLPTPRLSDLARVRGPDYLVGLNPEQRTAVEATEGPVLVLAGAGTGKTRVLTTRLAHILSTGKAKPWELLVVTFTNKAAREMRERITHIIGPEAEGLRWLGTFHSVAAQILRRHAELVGLKSNYTILDTDDQERLLKQVIEAEGIDHKRWTPKTLAGLIDHWKNRGWTPDKLPPAEGAQFANNKGQTLYRLYQDRLRVLNACDFGDLLLHNLTLFLTQPDVLAEFHRRFRYILVDEYQDTNVAQYLWLRLLGQAKQNVCCVGMMTSRSMAGGARRSIISSGSNGISRGRGSSDWNGIIVLPAHSGSSLRPDQRQQRPPGQDPLDGTDWGRKSHCPGGLGWRGREPPDRR